MRLCRQSLLKFFGNFCILLAIYFCPFRVIKRGIFLFLFSFYVRYSTLLHLPPLRFHSVGGCWNRTQDSCDRCDYGIGCQTLQPFQVMQPEFQPVSNSWRRTSYSPSPSWGWRGGVGGGSVHQSHFFRFLLSAFAKLSSEQASCQHFFRIWFDNFAHHCLSASYTVQYICMSVFLYA